MSLKKRGDFRIVFFFLLACVNICVRMIPLLSSLYNGFAFYSNCFILVVFLVNVVLLVHYVCLV